MSATLSGIAYFAQAIQHDQNNRVTQNSGKFLSLIRESATTVQESMSDIIWAINPENDRWDHLFAKFRRYASDLLESKSIQYHIEIPESISLKPLDMERRRNLWLVYKEMVTNAVKHSNCSNVTIKISKLDDSLLHLSVMDNGKGFDPNAPTERNGVKNIHARTALLHGKLYLQTSQGSGTHWQLEFNVQ